MGLLARIKSLFTSEPSPASGEATGWSIFVVQKDGEVAGLASLRTERPKLPARCTFARAALIEWTFAADGLPTPEQFVDIYAFERDIDELTEENDVSVQVRIRTAFGKRDWLFYLEDEQRFASRFAELTAHRGSLPITLAFTADPDWREWRATLEEVAPRVGSR